MTLAPGTRLGPYEILAPIGAGGMGKVYRARDSRLGRDVAIKVSAERFSERFEREARAIASLNHTNICHLYDVGPNYLVMELVEGETLAGPLRFEEALPILRQLIDGIEAAHERNIVHRDLKPANIKVTHDGVVKILDFGLAKATSPEPEGNSETSPTLTMGSTQAGTLLGTAAYMSPEQARGKVADKRADIWSFGVILYELLTGKKPFEGESVVETLGGVLNREPDWSQVPARVQKLLKWCLEKDRRQRLQAIGDARRVLDEAPLPDGRGSLETAGGVRFGMPALIVACVFAAAFGVLAFIHFREQPPENPMVRFDIPAPPGNAFGGNVNGVPPAPVVSPDGRKIAFLATNADRKLMVWIRSLDAEDARPLPGTEDVKDFPFWSPDSRSLGFVSSGKLKTIDLAGGPAQTICEVPTSAAGAWTADNRIILGTAGPVEAVPASGGTLSPLTVLDGSRHEVAHVAPSMLPDGKHFLYLRFSLPVEEGGVYIGSLDTKPEQQSKKRLLPDTTGAVYVPSPQTGDKPGWVLFVRGIQAAGQNGTLMARPFDGTRMEFTGDAVPVAEQVSLIGFSASPNGVLAFGTPGASVRSQLTWYDRNGVVLSKVGEPGEYRQLALSPDGKSVAYVRGPDLWLFEIARESANKLTFGNNSGTPVWSRDGSRIFFISSRAGGDGLSQKAANGAGQEELLYHSSDPKALPVPTPDGKFVLFEDVSTKGDFGDLLLLPMGGSAADRKPVPFLKTRFAEGGGRFSPDGRWVAFNSNQSGPDEIYTLPFDESNPGDSSSAGQKLISKGGGEAPRWSADGRELFYFAPDGYLMAVEMNVVGGTIQPRAPQRLFKSPTADFSEWDVSADGQRFLVAAPVSSGSSTPAAQSFHAIVNWMELLKR